MKVFFLSPNDKTSANKVLSEILLTINSEPNTLRIAVAYFTHPEIAKALVNRTQCGRDTKLIINASDILRPIDSTETEIVISKNLMEVLQLNLDVRTLGNRTGALYENMHHKFLVSEHKVIFGSLNWTLAALNNNYECVAISSEPKAIELFTREFERIWSQAKDFIAIDGNVRVIMCPICKSPESVDFESWGPVCISCGHRFTVA
jgi:phosphatidylserine/phosphatidylglycerophosphate/cardiolipin synthase-like enzyme